MTFVLGFVLGALVGALVALLVANELRLFRRARYGGPVDLTGVRPKPPNVRRRGDDSRHGNP